MKRTLVLSLVVSLILIGCVTANKMNNVSLGMTKPEVIAVMGNPTSTSAKGDTEYLNYIFTNRKLNLNHYFVRLINGKVESYGKLGDFDSTKDPKQKIDLSIEDKK